MKRYRYASFMIGFILFCPFHPVMGDVLDNTELHGFVSQGYLRSTDNNYLGNSKKGSYEFNEIGINLTSELTDELQFGMQLFSRDMGNFGNNELLVDWAAFDYNYQDWLAFRAGKIKLPFGFYNRKRNADMLRTSIIFPQSVYPEGIREFVVGLYGAGLHGTVRVDPLGYLEYELFGGTLNLSSNSTYISEMMSRYGAPSQSIMGVMQIHHMEGGMLIWNTPLTGLRVGGTTLMGEGEVVLPQSNELFKGIDFSIKGINTLSLEYDIKSLTFAAEYLRMNINAEIPGLPPFEGRVEGYYAELAWQATEMLALGLSYGEYYPNTRDRGGSELEAREIKDFFAWQKDITLSTKLNFSEYLCVKFETHFINGLGLTSLEDNPQEKAKEDWILFAVKTSLNF